MWLIYFLIYLVIGWAFTYFYAWFFFVKLKKEHRCDYSGSMLIWCVYPFIWPVMIFVGLFNYIKLYKKA